MPGKHADLDKTSERSRAQRTQVGRLHVVSSAAVEHAVRHRAGHGAGTAVAPAPPRVPLLTPRPARRRTHFLLDGPGWTALRVAGDLLSSLIAAVVAGTALSPILAAELVVLFPVLVVGCLSVRGLYARRMRESTLDLIGPLVGGISVAAMLFIALELLVLDNAAIGATVGKAWLLAVALVTAYRAVLISVQAKARERLAIGRPTVIVGAGMIGTAVASRLEDSPEYGLRPIGFLDSDPLPAGDGAELPVLGAPEDLSRVLAETGAEHVILAFSSEPDHGLVPLVRLCEQLGVTISLVPRLFESISDRVALERLGGLPLLGLRTIDPKGWQFRIKYALDRPLAALLLVLMAPAMLAAAIAVRLSSPGPIMFRQRRVGVDGHAFDLLKFRSMRVAGDRSGAEFRHETAPGGVEGVDRRTAVGRWLRRSAIDELPQLFNVLRGDMSLVGPRPERPEFVRFFELHHHRYSDRHRVKSGITGWSQVHGLRGQTSLADRVEWDNFYIENWSLWLDLKVLLLTLGAVMRSGEDA